MSFRSKRSTRPLTSKGKDTTSQTLQDVVSQVIRDVSAIEDQGDTPQSLNPDTDHTGATQPTQSTVVGLVADDIRSNKRNSGKRQSLTPSPSPQLVTDSQRPKASNRWSFRSKHADDQPIQGVVSGGARAEETKSLLADDIRSNKRKSGKRPSVTPSPSQPLVNDSQNPRASNKWSVRSQHIDDQPEQGVATGEVQAEETEIGSAVNVWTSDPSMTKPTQITAKETNDSRPNQKGASGRPSLTAPPSRTFPAESLDQPRHLQRLQNLVHENDGEPLQNGFTEARRQNPSEWDNDLDLYEREEEEEEDEEIDREPAQHGLSRSRGSNIAQWSNEIFFDEMEEVEMRDAKGKRGKKGGAINPRHVWSLRPGVRFVVPFNSLDQPVRKGGYVLIRFLGDIAKNCELCPIGEANWRRVDKSYKANIIPLVREKFIFPDRPEIDNCILKHVGKKWRNYRHYLKAKYKKPNKTQEQVASIVPKGVPPGQWVKLVQYWFSEKCKTLCEQAKEARDAQTHLHVTGSKSYARRRDEFEKVHGREPGALEWFLETHQRKDGTFVENTSKEFVDAAEALIAQRGSTSSRRTTAVENQVFNELMYSDDEQLYQKRPLGYGFGVTGNKLYGSEAESRKRAYIAAGIKPETGSSKKKLFRRNSGYLPPDSNSEVERLNFAMTAMGETNQLMRGQIKMQSQQLQMQSQQLQMQSKQIGGLQGQLQQVTSLLTKFGVMLNNPQPHHHMPKGAFFQGVNVGPSRQVPNASSEYTDDDSDSTDWDTD